MYNAPVDPTPDSRFPIPRSRLPPKNPRGKWQVPSQLLKIARL